MKKRYIALIIIMLVTFSLAVAFFFVELKNIGLNSYNVNETETLNLTASMQKIEIYSEKVSVINILATDENFITAKLSGTYSSMVDKSISLITSNKNKVIKIESKETGILKYLNTGNYNGNSLELNVYIPKTFINELKLEVTSNNVLIQDVNTKNININGAIGNLNVEGVSCDIAINGIIDIINLKYRSFNNRVEISGVSNNVMINVPNGSDYIVEKYAMSSKTTYYLDNEINNNVRTNSANKIILNGINVELNVREFTDYSKNDGVL